MTEEIDIFAIEITDEQWEAAKLRVPPGMDKHLWEEMCDKDYFKGMTDKEIGESFDKLKNGFTEKELIEGFSGLLLFPEETKECAENQLYRQPFGTLQFKAVKASKEVLEAKEKNKEVGSSSNVRITRKKKPANQRKDKHRGYSSAMSKKQCEKAVTACSGFEGQLESLGGKFDVIIQMLSANGRVMDS